MLLLQIKPVFKDNEAHIIPSAINTEYHSQNKSAMRLKLGIPENPFTILFSGASTNETRKGFDLFLIALKRFNLALRSKLPW